VKNSISKHNTFEAVIAQGIGETAEPPIQKAAAFFQIVITVSWYSQRLGIFTHISFRQKIAVELLIVLSSVDPYIARRQPGA
jgi:hypothetical protein